ncbi:MAG: thermonuclease family protein [Proteobacteria bacterium]|jgi:hypothetical protein|nr:thermonuclease family protein [Pseudomonadota bacterium]
MSIYDVLVLLFIAFLVGWAVWDYKRRRAQKQFISLLVLAPILISLASLLFGMWGCHKIRNTIDKFFGKTVTKTEVVVTVDSGNVIKLKAGIRDRSRRTKNCTLWGISIPAEVEKEAKVNLEQLISADDEIRVEIKEGAEGWVEDKFGDISGLPYSKSGENCCLEQLKAGLAKVSVEKDNNALLAAQKEAQKAHRGIWAKKKTKETEEGGAK